VPDAPSTTAVAEKPAQPTTPAPESQPPQAKESAPDAKEATEGESTPDIAALWKALSPDQRKAALATLDADEIIGLDPRISGKIGVAAQKQAPALAKQMLPALLEQELPKHKAQWETERQYRDRLSQMSQVVETGDTVAAFELVKEQKAAADAYEAEQLRAAQASDQSHAQVRKAWDRAVAYFTSEAVPEEVRAKLYDKKYGTDLAAATEAFWRDIADARAEHEAELRSRAAQAEVEKRRAELEQEFEAKRKELLGETSGSAKAPDSGAGGGPAGALTRTEYDANKAKPGWIKENRARISDWQRAGMP